MASLCFSFLHLRRTDPTRQVSSTVTQTSLVHGSSLKEWKQRDPSGWDPRPQPDPYAPPQASVHPLRFRRRPSDAAQFTQRLNVSLHERIFTNCTRSSPVNGWAASPGLPFQTVGCGWTAFTETQIMTLNYYT